MNEFSARHPCDRRDEKGKNEGHEIVGAKEHAYKVSGIVIALSRMDFWRQTKVMGGHCRGGVDPHGEQAEPGEDLHPSQTPHPYRHRPGILNDGCQQPFLDFLIVRPFTFSELLVLFRAVFPDRCDGVENGGHQQKGPYIERPDHIGSDHAFSGCIGHTKPIGQYPRKEGAQNGPHTNEDRLHAESNGSLLLGQHIAHQGTKGFHADIEGGIHEREKCHADPKNGRDAHEFRCLQAFTRNDIGVWKKDQAK